MAKPKEDKEIERDPEEVLRRMLNTPPKPQKDIKGEKRVPIDGQEEGPSAWGYEAPHTDGKSIKRSP